jgi:pyrroline-5-carboxylate reductase
MVNQLKIGFLGAGKMATALAMGFIKGSQTTPDNIFASDFHQGARSHFSSQTGSIVFEDNDSVIERAGILFICVKPDQVTGVLKQAAPKITPDHLIISIAAGIPIKNLEEALPSGSRVIRVMPNTPALVGTSASGFALGTSARTEDGKITQQLLNAVGVAFEFKESLLDAVTGLSGSGPAYAYLIIEALSDGGVAAGLPRDAATRLAAQTMLGAARMVLDTGMHPGALKDMVTSPGGTTIEGIHELEKAGVRAGLMNAVRAATEKSKKLGGA